MQKEQTTIGFILHQEILLFPITINKLSETIPVKKLATVHHYQKCSQGFKKISVLMFNDFRRTRYMTHISKKPTALGLILNLSEILYSNPIYCSYEFSNF